MGLGVSKSDNGTMFTDLLDRKGLLPTLSHIEFRWREEDGRQGFCQPETGLESVEEEALRGKQHYSYPPGRPSLIFAQASWDLSVAGLYIRSRNGIQTDSEMPRTSSRLLLGSV